jgi:hypothetical protein
MPATPERIRCAINNSTGQAGQPQASPTALPTNKNGGRHRAYTCTPIALDARAQSACKQQIALSP